jgi:hypothetical protein
MQKPISLYIFSFMQDASKSEEKPQPAFLEVTHDSHANDDLLYSSDKLMTCLSCAK